MEMINMKKKDFLYQVIKYTGALILVIGVVMIFAVASLVGSITDSPEVGILGGIGYVYIFGGIFVVGFLMFITGHVLCRIADIEYNTSYTAYAMEKILKKYYDVD